MTKEQLTALVQAYIKNGYMTVETQGLLADLVTDGLGESIIQYQDRYFVIHDLGWTWTMFESPTLIRADQASHPKYTCLLCNRSIYDTDIPIGWVKYEDGHRCQICTARKEN